MCHDKDSFNIRLEEGGNMVKETKHRTHPNARQNPAGLSNISQLPRDPSGQVPKLCGSDDISAESGRTSGAYCKQVRFPDIAYARTASTPVSNRDRSCGIRHRVSCSPELVALLPPESPLASTHYCCGMQTRCTNHKPCKRC